MSLYGESAKSPLEHVWRQFVPQGYDQALRNAFYNVAAIVFVGCVAAAAWSVYMIFQPFVQPLLWAVLCGSLLHPAKHTFTTWTSDWLAEVQSTHGLLSVSVALLPLRVIDTTTEIVGRFVVRHVKGVVMVTVILPLLYIIIHHTPTFLSSLAYSVLSCLATVTTAIVSIITTNGYIALTLITGYLVAVAFFWTDGSSRVLGHLSVPVWLVAAAGVSGLWPAGSVVLFLVLVALLLAGLCVEVLDVHSHLKSQRGENVSMLEAALVVCRGVGGSEEEKKKDQQQQQIETTPYVRIVDSEDESHPPTLSPVAEEEEGTDGKPSPASSPESSQTPPKSSEDTHKPATGVEETEEKETAAAPPSAPSSETPRPKVLLGAGGASISPSTPRRQRGEENGSNIYLKGVFVGCILVELWRHNYLLPLLPTAMIYYGIKKLASRYLAWSAVNGSVVANVVGAVRDRMATFLGPRRPALLPAPIRGVVKLLVRTDSQAVKILVAAVDALVTLFLILSVIFFAVTASIYLAVQIQAESMALVSLGSQVINSTIVNNPQFLALLPDGLGEVMTNALDEGYIYGRQWIATMLVEGEGGHTTINASKVVRGMLGETDDVKAAQLEKQVVELWDRVYQAWVAAHPPTHTTGPVVTSEAVAMSFDSLMEGLKRTPGVVSFSLVSEVVGDNLGTVMSVLESVWGLLLGNLSLALSALTAAASLLLGGSLSILNALISVVVFMSSLFYVLSASGPVYKPVDIMVNLAPGQMTHLGKAVEDAVNGVFIASLKMGAFYGMWTWLLHSLFNTNIVYIPSVLGAVFGAVPLVGTYWAAFPGALELFWHRESPSLAALLLVAQLLPMSCVDTAIYSDIKGGSHPYLTGLAVAGGVFYWGVEGAILGPLLLCILKVATNMYSSLIQSPADLTRRFAKLRRCQSEVSAS
ncbi:transmembrane protein 245-like isoform X3 [Eriocheir sinensis]|uniref:transmembrane protein 245-like isoform X3 n=1 Tax=Eriocheir sinensis TaxID=95602 RepID=UPI0021C96427|nr:transmembrane protein 245-like isoform X3 [Eriocheir sinensis]